MNLPIMQPVIFSIPVTLNLVFYRDITAIFKPFSYMQSWLGNFTKFSRDVSDKEFQKLANSSYTETPMGCLVWLVLTATRLPPH